MNIGLYLSANVLHVLLYVCKNNIRYKYDKKLKVNKVKLK